MLYIGEFYSLLTACLWSGSSIAFTAAARRIGSVQVNISRLIMAAGYLIVLVLLCRLDLTLSTMQIVYLSISGFIGFTLGDTFLFKAFKLIGARISMLIMSLAPAVAAFLAYIILGENLSLWGVVGIIVTLTGIAIVILGMSGGTTNGSVVHHVARGGIVLAILGAVGQGGGLIFAKMAFLEGSINGFVATLIRILASLVVLLPVSIISGRYKNPVQVFRNDPSAFKYTVLGSIFGPFLGVTSSLMAIQYTKVGIAATIMATTPIVMLPLVRFVQKEHLSWRAIAGAFIATLGVALLFLP
ncbi:MAG TPA: DMT family transporter [Bacteroidota bacterium]|nr:DMT family transporter [Bacteroidota bacterium]